MTGPVPAGTALAATSAAQMPFLGRDEASSGCCVADEMGSLNREAAVIHVCDQEAVGRPTTISFQLTNLVSISRRQVSAVSSGDGTESGRRCH